MEKGRMMFAHGIRDGLEWKTEVFQKVKKYGFGVILNFSTGCV